MTLNVLPTSKTPTEKHVFTMTNRNFHQTYKVNGRSVRRDEWHESIKQAEKGQIKSECGWKFNPKSSVYTITIWR